MAGIYIHIPYCRKACYYCNFHFSTSTKSENEMVSAIGKELSLRKDYLDEKIDTIYFGGGTPSILTIDNLGHILNQVRANYKISSDAEITLEANPEDINSTSVEEFIRVGINRISLGVQSFDDDILKSLNRNHSKSQAIDAISIIQQAGINNLTIDLIYGIPDQSYEIWQNNLSVATDMQVPHISCYALTFEEKTVFGQWQKKGKVIEVSEARYEEEYSYMCSFLADIGYEHYEVSNFARAGMRSRHNSSYWLQEPYIGIGPGAHSYNNETRQFNIENNARYIKSLTNNELACKQETLSKTQLYNEYVLTRIRTSKGIVFRDIEEKFNVNLLEKHRDFLDRCKNEGLAEFDSKNFILTDKALLLSDSIILELMIDE